MPWSVPATVVTGDIITAAWGNTYVRDNPAYLMSLLNGTGGAITVTVPDRLQVSNDGNFALYKLAGGPIFVFDSNDYIYFDRASNYWQFVIDGLQKYLLDSNGKITGAGFYDSGNVTITAGASQTFTHGLGAQPRFVGGVHDNGAGAGSVIYTLHPSLYAPGTASVRWDQVNASSLLVNNNTAASRIVRVWAML